MSGIISVGAALATTAMAASSVAAAGTLTIGGAFAIIGAVGATVGAVGAITKVKELQYAGAALGAVGLVGGLASAAGLFGEAASIFGSMSGSGLGATAAGTTAAETASPFVSAASGIDAGTWAGTAAGAVAAPTAGYESVGALMEGQGIVAGEIPGGYDAINMANGIPQVNVGESNTPFAQAPNVTPEAATNTAMGTFGEGHSGVVDSVPPYESATKGYDFSQAQYDAAAAAAQGAPSPPVDGRVPDPAKGLLDLGVSDRPLPQDFGLDEAGNMVRTEIPQGGGDVVGAEIGPGRTNQAAPTSVYNNPIGSAPQAASPTPTPLAAEGTSAAQSASASAGGPQFASNVTGHVDKLQAPTSVWSDIGNFIQKNQTLSYGAIQAVGSFVSGAMKPGTDQSVLDELSSRQQQNIAVANLYNQQAAMLQRRMENMTNLPVASRQPRAPTPGYGLAGYGVTGQAG